VNKRQTKEVVESENYILRYFGCSPTSLGPISRVLKESGFIV
jgi:hypothetical protein